MFITHREIAQIHKEYGVFLTPTRMDSQGVSRDEAMASGLVPVTTAVTAIPEFVDNRSGFLVKPESAAELAAAILHIYENPDEFRAKSIAAAKRVRSQCASNLIANQEISLFASVSQG